MAKRQGIWAEIQREHARQARARQQQRRGYPRAGRRHGDKHATKGILITTSWVTKDGHASATRHGRIEIMECEHVKYLCKEHLGLDVLISLPKPPPR